MRDEVRLDWKPGKMYRKLAVSVRHTSNRKGGPALKADELRPRKEPCTRQRRTESLTSGSRLKNGKPPENAIPTANEPAGFNKIARLYGIGFRTVPLTRRRPASRSGD